MATRQICAYIKESLPRWPGCCGMVRYETQIVGVNAMPDAPLILSWEVIADLHRLRALAMEHPIDIRLFTKSIGKELHRKRYRRQIAAQTVTIPGPSPYHAVLVIETGHADGTFRHMNLRVEQENHLPHPVVVWMVAQHLGFADSLHACRIWFERLGPTIQTVHAMQSVTISSGHPAIN